MAEEAGRKSGGRTPRVRLREGLMNSANMSLLFPGQHDQNNDANSPASPGLFTHRCGLFYRVLQPVYSIFPPIRRLKQEF